MKAPICGLILLAAISPVCSASESSPALPTTVVKEPLRPWQERRLRTNKVLAEGLRSGTDPSSDAFRALDAVLTDFEMHPTTRTPIENLDLLGMFYVPKDGFDRALPVIAMNCVLGWYDVLRFATTSGRAEVLNNERFFARAMLLGGEKAQQQSVAFLENHQDEVRKLVEQGISFAEKYRSTSSYERTWPSAYGLERMIAALGGATTRSNAMSESEYDQAWAEAVTRTREYFVVKQSARKEPNQPSEPTATGVTPPAGAGDRAAGSRGSP